MTVASRLSATSIQSSRSHAATNAALQHSAAALRRAGRITMAVDGRRGDSGRHAAAAGVSGHRGSRRAVRTRAWKARWPRFAWPDSGGFRSWAPAAAFSTSFWNMPAMGSASPTPSTPSTIPNASRLFIYAICPVRLVGRTLNIRLQSGTWRHAHYGANRHHGTILLQLRR